MHVAHVLGAQDAIEIEEYDPLALCDTLSQGVTKRRGGPIIQSEISISIPSFTLHTIKWYDCIASLRLLFAASACTVVFFAAF